MSTPYFTSPQLPVKNTPWKKPPQDTDRAAQFEEAFIPLTVICAWCKTHLSGPTTSAPDRVSHGICGACAEKYKRMIDEQE